MTGDKWLRGGNLSPASTNRKWDLRMITNCREHTMIHCWQGRQDESTRSLPLTTRGGGTAWGPLRGWHQHPYGWIMPVCGGRDEGPLETQEHLE